MRPARLPISKKDAKIAVAIDRARRCGFDPDYQEAIHAVAHEISVELVVPSEQASFLLACGVDAHPAWRATRDVPDDAPGDD